MRRVPEEDRQNYDDTPQLAAGTHDVIITEVSAEKNTKTGKPYRWVRFDKDGLVHSETFQLELEWKWEQLVAACGYDLDTLPDEYDETQLEGSRLQITIAQKGDYMNIVKRGMRRTQEVRPWPGSEGKTREAKPKPKPKPVVPAQEEQDEPENDDEMPF